MADCRHCGLPAARDTPMQVVDLHGCHGDFVETVPACSDGCAAAIHARNDLENAAARANGGVYGY